jgi:hypothetical protein
VVFITRDASREPGRFLEWKLRLFIAGAVFFALGIGLKRDALVLAAIGVLAVAVLLRALEARGRHPRRDDGEDELGEDEEGTEDGGA